MQVYANTVGPPPVADERIAVIVPVLDRPHHAVPFMESLRTSTPFATAYAVCSQVPDAAAWRAAGATLRYSTEKVTFAEKANVGCRSTKEPWLLFVGSDVKFHPYWWDEALAFGRAGFSLISTNDMANSAVVNGNHATHPVIRRSYIDEIGASWDGPGTVAHEGYRHWFVDNEWTCVARQHGVFAYAPRAIIEHLHPIAGKAEMDAVYQIGYDNADADAKLFAERYERYAA